MDATRATAYLWYNEGNNLRCIVSRKLHSYQGGATLTVGIVGAVLALVLLGTIFFVVQRGQQLRQDQAIGEAEQIAQQNQPVTQTPVVVTPPAPQPESTAAPTPSQPTELPTTGSELSIALIIMLGCVAGTTVSYVMSRRALQRAYL